MKTCIFSDLHFMLKNREIALSCLKLIEKECKARQIKFVTFLGDFFNDKSIIRSEVLREAYDFFEKSKLKWILFVGNHDFESTYGDSRHHALEVFERLKNVYIIDKKANLREIYGEECTIDIWAFPYYHSTEDLIKDLAEVPDQSIVFCHQGVEGFHFSSGVCQKSQLKKDHFFRFKRVLIGHIHSPQESNNVMYVGSPFTHTFGEAGEKKRILFFDLDTAAYEELLPNLPKHYYQEIILKSEEDLNNVKIEANKEDFVKLKFFGPKELLTKVNKSLFTGFDHLLIQTKELGADKQILISENMSYDQMLETFVNNNIKTTLEKKDILSVCHNIMREVHDANLGI